MENLAERIEALRESLAEFQAGQHPPLALGDMYNTLLSEARAQFSAEGLEAIPAVEEWDGQERCDQDAATMRAHLKQILAAMGETGPASGVQEIG